ncbi:MAG: ABC transporter ATP-binding protein [Bilifractor sp.]|jgi:ATP-binding cassette subfamily B protein
MRAGKKDRPVRRWMRHVAGKKIINILWLTLLQVFQGVSGILFALFLGRLIDDAVAKNLPAFTRTGVLLLVLLAAMITASALNRYLAEYTRSDLENCFKNRLFSDLLDGDYAHVAAIHSGEWMNRLTSDTTVVANGMADIYPNVIGLMARMIGAVVMILIIIPKLIYIVIPGGILLFLFSWSFRKKLKALHRKVREKDGNLRVFLSETLGSLMIVKSFAREKQSSEEADLRMAAHRKARMDKIRFSNICNIGFGAAMDGAYVVGAIYCSYRILRGTMSYGTFTVVLRMIAQIQSPAANISGYLPRYYSMIASAERLIEAEQIPEDEGKDALDSTAIDHLYHTSFAGFRFENAGFTYLPPVSGQNTEEEPAAPEDPKANMPVVIRDLNLSISKGDYIAFTGPSGCGKSTILKLLMCLYPLDCGTRSILLKEAGHAEKEIPLTGRYRKLFAYVPQGNQLMTGTIREIVTFANREDMNSEAAIWNALRIACADEFVSALRDGIDTRLGERGTGLSEGQMQRIAIARAVFSDHPILILDESTSALDVKTEQQLLANLRSMTDRTVLIVSHRPEVLKICSKQVLMSERGVTVRKNNI